MRKTILNLAYVLFFIQNVHSASSPEITYSSSTSGFSEIISTNDGTVEGELVATLSGATFSNPSGLLTAPDDFEITNLPSGLEAKAVISADGTVATINLDEDAYYHQAINGVSDLIITFENSAFSGVTASEVTNALNTAMGFGVSFATNPVLTYTGEDFLEVAVNDGSLTGVHNIEIEDGNFSNAGGTLSYEDDFNIVNLPSGLDVLANVSADGSLVTISLTGSSNEHQVEDNVNRLNYVFENSAFDNVLASSVFNYSAYAPNGIDFNDNPALSYSSESNLNSVLQIRDIKRSDKESYRIEGENFEFAQDGMLLFVGSDNTIQAYQIDESYDFSSIETIDENKLELDELIDFEFSNDGKKVFVLVVEEYYSEVIREYALSTAFDLSSASLSELVFNPLIVAWDNLSRGEYETGTGGFDVTDFTFGDNGSKVFVTHNRGGVLEFNLTNSYDLSGPVFNSLFRTTSQEYGEEASCITFSDSGDYVFIADENSILGYQLSAEFDLTTISYNNADKVEISATLYDLVLVDDESFYLLEGNFLKEYIFQANVFREKDSDNGSLEGSLNIEIVNAIFSNPSGSLSYGTDYNIANLPSGLVSELSVSADGSEATLLLSGNADNHSRVDDVGGLVFTFENSAFNTLVDVKDIFSASEYNSTIPIRFLLDDKISPRANIDAPVTSGGINSSFQVTVTFSEPVNDFEQEDILIDPIKNLGSIGYEIENFQSSNDRMTYTFDFETESGDVFYGIRVYTFSAFDDAGNGNLLGDTLYIKTGEYRNNEPVVEDQVFTVPEYATGGTVVGKLIGSDGDSDNLYFSLYHIDGQVTIGNYFEVNGKDEIIVKDGVTLDPNVIDLFEFKIEASDGVFNTTANGTIYVSGPLDAGSPQHSLNKLEVYPNPSKDILHVNWENQTEFELHVLDLAGNFVHSNISAGADYLSIDISSLKKGLYVLVLNSGNQKLYKKFMKF